MSYNLGKMQEKANERRQGRRWLNYHWRQSWRNWMDRRLPPQSKVELSHRNIFISPSRAGAAYIGLCFVLLLVAINFQNSAVYGLTFLLASIFVVSIFHTFRNLSGVSLTAAPTSPVFAGNEALFTTVLSTAKSSSHLSLFLSWQGKTSVVFDIQPGKEANIAMRYQVGPRGFCRPGRIKLESRYPFGLLSVRTYIDVLHEVLVYPFPVDHADPSPSTMTNYESGPVERLGSDDFFGLRDYQNGDSVKNIAWRSYAKNERLVVKQFVDYFDHRNCFCWDQITGNTEDRLSQMAYWAIQSEAQGEKYAIQLPGFEIEADVGSAHLANVLTRLALFGKESTSASKGAADTAPSPPVFEVIEGKRAENVATEHSDSAISQGLMD